MATGDRPGSAATEPFEAPPQEYRCGAFRLTDFRPEYRGALPDGGRGGCGKGDGPTSHFDRSSPASPG